MEARQNSLSLFYKNCLKERVGLTDCVNDLILMFQFLPLNHLKNFITQEIDELDSKHCKKAYYETISIDEIFPSDIIQYILSFGGLYHTKAVLVSKKWKQFSEQNEQNHLTKLYSSINEIKSPVKYDANMNKTYIISQHRTKLHKMESVLGYKGPMKDIERTLSICDSGDRLLVDSGVYSVSKMCKVSIQLIGVGTAVTVCKSWDIDPSWYIRTKCDIRNIAFDMSGLVMEVEENGILQLDNCELRCGEFPAVCAKNGSHLNMNNCRFIGDGYKIKLSPFAREVNIIDCTFQNVGIEITPQRPQTVNEEMMQLQCVGNIFDIDKHIKTVGPITTRNNNYVANSDRYTLKDNLLKRTSGKAPGGFNPNKIKVFTVEQHLLLKIEQQDIISRS